MAGDTGLGDNRVIHCYANPARRNVTTIATGSRRNMRSADAGSDHTIMTRLASAGDLRMINA